MRLIIASLLIIAILAVAPHPPKTDTRPPEEFIINLDLSYEQRWRQLATVKKDDIAKLIQFLYNNAPYKYILPVANFILDPLLKWYNSPFLQECKALAKLSNVPLETIVLVQYLYELGTHKTKMCTAVLVDRGDHVFHSRNLDYDFAELLAGLTVHLNFQKGGKTIFKAATQAGFLGVHTGVAEGRFSINLNERDQSTLAISFWQFITGKWSVTKLIRHVLQTAKDYNQAVQMLKSTEIISPAYFIVSGLQHDQGMVITRDRSDVYDIYTLAEARQQGRNFIVHTNYDRNVADPVFDYRRMPAELKMTILGVDRDSEDGVMQLVMSDFPTLNSDTLLTATMIAKDSYMNSTIWY